MRALGSPMAVRIRGSGLGVVDTPLVVAATVVVDADPLVVLDVVEVGEVVAALASDEPPST